MKNVLRFMILIMVLASGINKTFATEWLEELDATGFPTTETEWLEESIDPGVPSPSAWKGTTVSDQIKEPNYIYLPKTPAKMNIVTKSPDLIINGSPYSGLRCEVEVMENIGDVNMEVGVEFDSKYLSFRGQSPFVIPGHSFKTLVICFDFEKWAKDIGIDSSETLEPLIDTLNAKATLLQGFESETIDIEINMYRMEFRPVDGYPIVFIADSENDKTEVIFEMVNYNSTSGPFGKSYWIRPPHMNSAKEPEDWLPDCPERLQNFQARWIAEVNRANTSIWVCGNYYKSTWENPWLPWSPDDYERNWDYLRFCEMGKGPCTWMPVYPAPRGQEPKTLMKVTLYANGVTPGQIEQGEIPIRFNQDQYELEATFLNPPTYTYRIQYTIYNNE